MICILARRGLFLETILKDESQEWRPADAARTAPQGGPDPDRQAVTAWCGQSLAAPVPLPGAGFVGPHPKIATVERRELSRSPRDGGSRVAGATEVESEAVGAPSTPHRGDGIAAIATVAGLPADTKAKAHAKRRTNPGAATRRGNEQ